MTDASLTRKALTKLKASRITAIDNLKFYECLYDDMDETPERETIGQAMAQKQSYIGAVEAILKNHNILVSDRPVTIPANDCEDVLRETDAGDYIIQEDRFTSAIAACLKEIDDALTTELLNHHLEAAELAATSIKSSSLII